MSIPEELITCTPMDDLDPAEMVAVAKTVLQHNPDIHPNIAAIANIPIESVNEPEYLAVVRNRRWGPGGVHLTVGFLDNPSTGLRKKILFHMNAWGKTANVEFWETANINDAKVRINRTRHQDSRWNGYWSFLGVDILVRQGPYNQTMNLMEFTERTPDAEFYRVVRHETGHTLGFPHEHLRASLVDKIDKEKAIAYYFNKIGWPRDKVIQQVLTPLKDTEIIATPSDDSMSIMCYQIPKDITIDNRPIPVGLDIDKVDYDFAGLVYPKPRA